MLKLKAAVIAVCCFAVTTLVFSQTPQKKPFLDGIWLSDGYGYMIEINWDSLRMSEITSISCIQTTTGKRQSSSAKGDIFAFEGIAKEYADVPIGGEIIPGSRTARRTTASSTLPMSGRCPTASPWRRRTKTSWWI